MGGKTSTTSQSVSIPPQVLARYNAVNTRAEAVATQPFQQYSQNPNAFVAPINQQQYAGIGGINQAAGLAQPYYGTAAQMTMAGAGSVSPEQYSGAAVQKYMNPYISNVANTTAAQMGNLFGQQAEELKGGAIRAGAFGGDRAGIAQGNLANQQGLAFGQQMANIYGQGFGQAQQQFNQQQGVNLGAEQANQARMLAAGQQLGGLGGAAQQSALQGAQAMLGAGTLEQQTQQAGLTALYNQFQQQQAYPFQVAQFLGNIAMGTGALSGSNTTTTQPAPFFSDERMKDNVEPIGETYDGQKIVKFNYKGDKQKQIGLIAQDVEKHHPEAVGLAGGMKTVDYDGATQEAARRGKAMGGLASEGGAVMPMHAGQGFAVGGMPESVNTAGLDRTIAMQQAPQDMAGLAAQAQQFAPQFEVPKKVTDPVFNPQPVAGSGGKEFTNWNDYLTGLATGRDMNDPSVHPYVAPPADTAQKRASNIIKSAFARNGGDNRSDNRSPYGNAGGGLSEQGQRDLSEYGGIFANGGSVGYADGGMPDIDSILARHAQIYAGLRHPGMPREGGFAGLPHGAKSHVPEANLPVRELMRPSQAPQVQDSGISEALKIANMFDPKKEGSISDFAKRAYNYLTDKDEEDEDKKAHGGALSYKSGGTLPYGEEDYSDTKLGIPNDKSELKLPTAPTPQQQGSGLSTLGTALSIGKTLLGFFEQGGRVGYQEGGEIEAIKRSLAKIESGGEKDPYRAIGPETRKGNRAYGKYQVMDFNIPTWTAEALGKPMTPEEFLNSSEAQEAVASHKLGQYYKQHGTADDAASMWFTGKPVAKAGLVSDATPTTKGTTNVEYLNRFRAGLGDVEGPKTAGLSPASETKNQMPENASSPEMEIMASAAPKSAGLAPVNERPAPAAAEGKEGKKSSGLGMNQETAVPLLTGLGAMLASRSPYLASAIGEGLVAGGQSYMGTQKAAADIAAKEAEKEAIMGGIPRIQEAQGIAFFLVRQPDGQYGWIKKTEYSPSMGAPIDPNSVPKSDLPPLPSGESAGLAGGTTPTAATGLSPEGAPTEAKPVNVTDLDPNSMKALDTELQSLATTGPGPRKDLLNPAIAEGNAATKLVTDLNQYAMNLSMLPKDSLIAGSVFSPEFLEMKKTAKQLIDQFKLQGLVPDFLEPDLTGANWAEEINKVKAAITAGRTGEAGQRAVAALDKFAEMLPDTTTSFAGRRDNTAAVMVRNQQDIERGQFAQNWFNEAARRGGDAQANLTGNSMNEAFQNKTEAQYRQDKETLKKLFETTIEAPGTANHGMTYLAYLAKKDKPITPKERDFIIQKFGNPAIFRYFPNLGVK